MDTDAVWQAVDEGRLGLAALLDDLRDDEWDVASLCTGWRVREVAAHLTLAHLSPWRAGCELVVARGSFDRMIDRTARRQALRPSGEHAVRLRAMVGSRRRAPFVSPLEPLIDVLVHGQDIAVPLGRPRELPVEPTVAALERAWSMGFPFAAQRRLRGLRLVATDASWAAGSGAPVEGPAGALLLLVTGRRAGLDRLTGAGAARLLAGRTG
jgi:uncharacterized protein (TIGR03083 family)